MTRLLCTGVLVLAFTANTAADVQSSSATDEEETTKATFLITGLHCPPCTRTVESSLSKSEGIHSINVNWKTKNARVEFDESVIAAQTVSKLIADTRHMMGGNMRYSGWLVLKVPSIKDDASAKPVREALAKIEGVRKVLAYPKQRSVGVQFSNKGILRSHDLIAALKQAGIEATIF